MPIQATTLERPPLHVRR